MARQIDQDLIAATVATQLQRDIEEYITENGYQDYEKIVTAEMKKWLANNQEFVQKEMDSFMRRELKRALREMRVVW